MAYGAIKFVCDIDPKGACENQPFGGYFKSWIDIPQHKDDTNQSLYDTGQSRFDTGQSEYDTNQYGCDKSQRFSDPVLRCVGRNQRIDDPEDGDLRFAPS
ncbi:MAG: hypothetical protein U0T74_09685 [Chitinophagales bacterium]